MFRRLTSLLLCLLGPGLGARAQDLEEVTSPHYALSTAGSEDERRELLAFLEAAFGQLEDVLNCKPDESALPLRVVLFDSEASWKVGLARRAAVPPPQVSSYWFRSEDGVAYAWGKAYPSMTRTFLLAAVVQQFHYFSKPKNEDLRYSWFVTGLATHLSFHRWDGERLTLGVKPLIHWLDMPEQALRAFDSDVLGYRKLSNERLRDIPTSWAFVAYCMAGPDLACRRRFQKLALGGRGSKMTGEEMAQALGNPDTLGREIAEWINEQQLPFRPLYGDWEDMGQGQLRARGTGAFSAAVLKERPNLFEVELDAAEAARQGAGVLLDWRDEVHYIAAFSTGRGIRVRRVDGSTYEDLASRTIPLESKLVFSVQRGSTSTVLIVNGSWIHQLEGDKPLVGLWTRNGDAEFFHPRWR